MRRRQEGVTTLGWIVLLTPFAIVLYAAIRLTPVYLNYMKVVRALEQAASDNRSATDAQPIRSSIDKRFDIDLVQFPTSQDVKIRRDGSAWVIEAAYEDEVPLIANVTLHVSFDKTVRTSGGGD
jgi:hypothetical protein